MKTRKYVKGLVRFPGVNSSPYYKRIKGWWTVVKLVVLPLAKNRSPGLIYESETMDLINDDLGGAPVWSDYNYYDDYNVYYKDSARWRSRYFVKSENNGEARVACLCSMVIGEFNRVVIRYKKGYAMGLWYCCEEDLTKTGKLLYRKLAKIYEGIGQLRILTFVDT